MTKIKLTFLGKITILSTLITLSYFLYTINENNMKQIKKETNVNVNEEKNKKNKTQLSNETKKGISENKIIKKETNVNEEKNKEKIICKKTIIKEHKSIKCELNEIKNKTYTILWINPEGETKRRKIINIKNKTTKKIYDYRYLSGRKKGEWTIIFKNKKEKIVKKFTI